MYKIINGWTKARMIEQVDKYIPDTIWGCVKMGPLNRKSCQYIDDKGNRCGAGAFMTEEECVHEASSGFNNMVGDFYHRNSDQWPLKKDGMVSLQEVHDIGIRRLSYESSEYSGMTAKERCIHFIEHHCQE